MKTRDFSVSPHQQVKKVSELLSDLRKIPVLRPVVPFVAGLLFLHFTSQDTHALYRTALPIVLGCVLLLPLVFRIRYEWGAMAAGIMFGVSFAVLGLLHHVSGSGFRSEAEQLDQQEGYLEGIVTDAAAEKRNSWLVRVKGKTFVNDTLILRLDEFVQVYLPYSEGLKQAEPGQQLMVYGRMARIRNDGNPGAFDYAGYMSRKRTRFNFFVQDTGYFRLLPERNTAPGYGPARLRQRIIAGWDRQDPDAAVLSALTVGYKSLLDRETKSAFSDAGAMHLLAVSGLHVGMIWWILEQMLRLPGNRPAWRHIRQLVVIAVLWGYAAVTGFSDSVTRAVTMFSLLSLSRSIQRKSNIYNTLLLSAFLLLVLKPSRILEPGFQLSYLAVGGIVTIQPLMEKIYGRVHPFPRRILDLVSVSIAAQVSTLPLVLAYFHQFPVWFLLTNLSAIPLVSIILALFVLFAPFLIFFPQWTIFSRLLLWLAGVLNKVVTGIASLPGAVIRDVIPDPAGSLLLMSILVCLAIFMYYRKTHFLSFAVLMFAIMLLLPVTRNRQLEGNSTMTVFNLNRATMISHVQDAQRETFLLLQDTVPDPYLQDYVRSLSGSPPGLKTHRILQLTAADSLGAESWMQIAEGLWAIQTGEWNVLIAGACDRSIIEQVIGAYDWQLILFRRGIPLSGWTDVLYQFPGRIVGDGTLWKYETRTLGDQISSIWLTGLEGALVIAGNREANR